MPGSIGQETILSLKTEIDNAGVQKFLSLLESNKLKSLATGAALAGLTKAVYSFISATVKQQFEIEQLARKQNMSISKTRAQQLALKSMGKTMQEIEKDASLKKVYKDILQFNRELEEKMPNMRNVIANVRKLQTEFWKLKSAVSYTIQSIGAQVLTNLEYPMDRIGGKMRSMSEWIRDRLPNVSITISRYLTAFAKGIIGIAETIGKVGELINKMPASIKAVVGALGTLFALLQGGPIGQILAITTLIGDIIHDYENYQWNLENGYGKGHEKHVKNLNDRYGIWDLLSGPEIDEEGRSRGERIATTILTGMTDAINSVFAGKEGEFVLGNLLTGKNGEGGIFGAAIRWMDDNEDGIAKLGQSILSFASNSIKFVGGFSGSALGNLFNAMFGNGTVDENIVVDETTATTFAGALGGFVNGLMTGLKDNKNFLDAAQKGLEQGVFGAIMGAITSNMTISEEEGVAIDWSNVQVDLTKSGESFIGIVIQGMGTGIDLASKLLGSLGDVLGGADVDSSTPGSQGLIDSIGKVFSKWSNNETIVGGLTTTIATALAGGNFVQSLIGGIFGAYMGARDKAENELYERAKRHAGYDSKKQEAINKMSVSEVKAYLESEGIETKDVYSNIFGDLITSAGSMIADLWDVACNAAIEAGDLGGRLLGSFLEVVVSALANPKESEVGANLQKAIQGLGGNEIFGSLGAMIGAKVAGADFWTSLITGVFTGVNSIQDLANAQFDGDFGKALQYTIDDFYNKILDMWYGPESEQLDAKGKKIRDNTQGLAQFVMPLIEGQITEIKDATGKVIAKEKKTGGGLLGWLFGYDEHIDLDSKGNEIKESAKHVKGIFEKAWSGDDGNGGIKSFFDDLAKDVVTWLDPVEKAIVEWFNNLIMDLTAGLPGWIKAGLGIGENARVTTVDGKPVIKDTNGGTYNGEIAQNISKAGLEYLSYVLPFLSIDKQTGKFDRNTSYGGIHPGERIEGITSDNKLGEETVSLASIAEYILKHGFMPRDVNGNEFSYDTIVNQYHARVADFDNSLKKSGDKEAPTVDVSKLTQNLSSAGGAVSTFASAVKDAAAVITEAAEGLTPKEGKAWGGRVGSEGMYTVGEDGAEYIIPITKQERAISLIKQMLSEMGSSAINRVFDGFGLGRSGMIGSSPASMASALQGMSMASTYNISAPININVQSHGADARAIGSSIYDTAESHLMKTLREVS